MTKVHLVKAVVFLIVMYGYESWTIDTTEQPKKEKLYTVRKKKKKDWQFTVAYLMNSLLPNSDLN